MKKSTPKKSCEIFLSKASFVLRDLSIVQQAVLQANDSHPNHFMLQLSLLQRFLFPINCVSQSDILSLDSHVFFLQDF